MADPEIDHGFLYDEQGRVDIFHSPFFDVHFSDEDVTANDYIDRILYQRIKFVSENILGPTAKKMEALEAEMEQLKARMEERFSGVKERFSSMENRFGDVEDMMKKMIEMQSKASPAIPRDDRKGKTL
ncbi:hypothetical protein M5K25_024791 [Dendrobium thyrsiflorum]|uniref:Uncharacterized protein n=1 Tax=Dendrobium thyrsiflorum TaxID=117978 RepID=A0ABD0U2V0_DENTH